MQGGDVAVAAPIDLADAAHGKRVEVAYDATVPVRRPAAATAPSRARRSSRARPATAPARSSRSPAPASASSCAPRSATAAAATAASPRRPCETCDGRGHAGAPAEGRGRRPGRDRRRPADPPHRPRPRRRARRPQRRPLRGRARARGRALPARRRGPDHGRRRRGAAGRARHHDRGARRSTAPVPVEVPAGTQPGETDPAARPRHAAAAAAGAPATCGSSSTSRSRAGSRAEQRDLLERLAGTITEENLRSDEGMFAKLKRALAG